MGRYKNKNKEWVKCPKCGAHAAKIEGKFYCRKCGKEDEIQNRIFDNDNKRKIY